MMYYGPYNVLYYICHALEMMGAWQQPHTALSSVAPSMMHTGTNQKAQ